MGNIFVNDIKLNSGQSGVYYGEAILGYNFELRPYEIDIDELISLLILKEENLISIFDLGVVDQSIFRRLIHSKFKSYFNDGTFDFDSVNKIIYEEVSKDEANEENELIESINAEITRKKSFYSFLAEALQYIIISEISNTEVQTGEFMNLNSIHQVETGLDSWFYSADENMVYLGEAKFYKSLRSGVSSIKKSMSYEIGSKYVHLDTMLESNLIFNQFNGSPLQILTNTKNVIFGFILNYDDKSFSSDYDFINSTEATEVLRKEFEGFYNMVNSITIEKCIFVNLRCTNKNKLIYSFLEVLNEKIRECN